MQVTAGEAGTSSSLTNQTCRSLLEKQGRAQVWRTRHAGYCWRSRDELISDVLLWTPTYGRAKAGRPARTYIQQLCEDTGCGPEDLPEVMNDREKWRERVRDIRVGGMTCWWWWWWWSKVGNFCREWPEGSFSTSYYTEVLERRYFIPCIAPLYPWLWHYNADC